MAEQGYMLPPLEVFAVDKSMNRCTGSIPYTSLIWTRKYYECGQFEMTLPSNIYDPAWRFIVTDDRPETGIIQKVQYTDDPTYGNIDTVTISGFFLESIMNRRTFLDETPEEVTKRYYVDPPEAPDRDLSKPTIYQDSNGRYWYETPSGKTYGVQDGTPIGSDARIPGSEVQTDDSGIYVESGGNRIDLTKVNVQGSGMSYFHTSGSDTSFTQTYYEYSEESGLGQLGEVDRDISFEDGFGHYYWKDEGGNMHLATGVTEHRHEQYVVQRSIWDRTTNDGWVEYTVTVAGPWQTTSVEDITTECDNVQRVWNWARMYYQNQMLFEIPEITGEVKIVDPSFQLLGDLLYAELQTVEASYRVQYDFQNNTFTFSVWRGLDRTQAANMPEGTVQTLAEPKMISYANEVETLSDSPSLPSGYIPVEYIQANGNQYIDTGYVPKHDTKVECELTGPVLNVQNSPWNCLFGAADNMTNDNSFAVWRNEGLVSYFYADSPVGTPTGVSVLDSVDYSIVADGNILTINGSSTTAPQASFNCNWPMFIFGVNYGGSISQPQMTAYKLKSMDIYDGSQLVRSFKPCKRAYDGAIGLYESVNNQFYGNSGSGDFVAGPLAIEEEPAPVLDYQDLPSEYSQVEYLQSTGTQYIDTGFTPNNDTRTVCGVELQTKASAAWLFGSRVGSDSDTYGFLTYEQAYRSDYDANSNEYFDPGFSTFTIDKDKHVTKINGSTVSEMDYSSFTCPSPLYVFANNNNGSVAGYSSAKVYSLKIYDNSSLVRDMVPCVRNSDSTPGLYDKVNSAFYQNAGAGAFQYGPAVTVPDQLEYYSNSTTATGETPPTQGVVGQAVYVAQCGFVDEGKTFTGWNTDPSGSGTTYQPGSQYILTSGNDRLYAQWYKKPGPEPPDPSGKYPWAVFSDTWGTLYGYEAVRDDSNYRNKCYVLYDYDKPEFDESGSPLVKECWSLLKTDETTGTTTFQPTFLGWKVPYTSNRGFTTIRLEDDYDDRETYLDYRDEKPTGDDEWPRELIEPDEDTKAVYGEPVPGAPTYPVLKPNYDAFEASIEQEGRKLLNNDYSIINSLDTGDLRTDRYLVDYDLGDKVDLSVETVGMVKEARITGVTESYESGLSTIKLEIGDEQLSIIKKARLT